MNRRMKAIRITQSVNPQNIINKNMDKSCGLKLVVKKKDNNLFKDLVK